MTLHLTLPALARRIDALDDDTTLAALRAYAHASPPDASAPDTDVSPALAEALTQALTEMFGPPDADAAAAPSDAELARAALLAVAEDPAHHDRLAAVLSSVTGGPASESFGLGASIAIITAALIALQTRVKITRADGKTSLEITKSSMPIHHLARLAHRLIALVSRGNDA